ncbi:TRAP transporter substrate-binding protein [Planococcus sp. 4-30]|uniref:TRAP transporter substrate-binding protein n=1 Tax=Planococcus sp. 4-30 TaxID=2874583 RepID=UPI001CBF3AF9|nr:TRAP transporter substrate-binding protein [Planococcus sp. 4-30]
MKKFRNFMIIVTVALAVSIGIAVFTSDHIVESDEIITIRFGHGSAETNERHLAVMKFKELVERKSNGQIKVEVFPSEQLGSEAEMIESVTFNDLQMVAASAFSQYDQRISVFELPYLFETREQAWNVLDGEVGEEVAELFLENNLRILTYFENGFRHVTSNRPIKTQEDLAGLKIRTPEFPLSLSTFKAFGANPTPMAFGELYMGLQQGTVDAQENPIANIYASKFQEVQDYLNLTGHQYMPLPVAISDEFWHDLSAENQQLIKESSQQAAQFHRELVQTNEESMVEELQAGGMEIIQTETESFKKAASQVQEEFKAEFGDRLVDQILRALENDPDK